jgi:post-segregation antitoxin (ccd killing protein)
MSLLIGWSMLSAIKAKTDNLPDDPASQLLTASTAQATDIESQTDKLAGEAPITGSATQNWQTAEAEVVSIGASNTKYKVHDLSLNISALTGTAITVRLYKKVNGVERKVYEQVFNTNNDPPGLPIINGTWAIHDVLKVTLQSNRTADNGMAVDYDYMLEAM